MRKMPWMKLGAILTAGGLTTVALTGCTVSGSDEADSSTVRVIAQAGGPGEALEAAAKEYNELGLGAKVKVDLFDYDAVRERTVLGFNSGKDSYDVIALDYAWLPEYVENGYLDELNDPIDAAADEIDPDDYIDAYMAWATIDDAQYALPWFGAVYMLYYRTDLLEQAGIEVPATWDEYLAAAEKLQESTGVAGTTLIGKRDDPLLCEFWSIAWSYGADIWDGTEATLDSPETIEALELWKNVLASAPQDALSADWPAAAAAFSEGKTAMMINFSDTSDALLAEDSPNRDNIGFAALPAGPTGESTPNLGGWGLAVSSQSDQQDEAFAFMSWATTAEQQKAGLELGGSASRTSVLSDPELQEKYPYYSAALENYNNAVYFPVSSSWIDWEAAMAPALSEALNSSTDISAAVAESQSRLAAEITKD
ncbi:extracellular solute-binding protein [Microbacterium sp. A204]|uniref:extracellular solute-binding protein n=1 Tax=Microbacterium sp. A204 TaxID=3457321 RepID=UPI003FD00F29